MKKLVIKIHAVARPFVVVFFALMFLFMWMPSGAQHRVSIQVRPGASFATTRLADADLKTGYGLEGSVAYRVVPDIGLYAGWGWNGFSAGESFAGRNMDFEETGYAIGMQLFHPFSADLPFDYFLKAGLILKHIEVESPDAGVISDSGHGAGFQVEAGLSFPAGDQWNVIPGIKYESLTRELAVAGANYKSDLNYLSAGVTISYTF
ncbi:MAG TPA: outer membrane beta-barrel protein [Chryseosolibacter sp.]